MPDFRDDVLYLIGLYQKCRFYRSLPKAGGVLDQPAWLMEAFAVVDEVRGRKAAADAEKVERERAVNEKRQGRK